jgi:hydrogenase nickel incorporation protein HypA/HybF
MLGAGMHEYSVVAALLSKVDRQARLHHARTVVRVHVRLGELSGVDPTLFRTAFELLRQDQPRIAAAELELVVVDRAWECPQCVRPIAGEAALRCPDCDAPARLTAGAEILLERLELELDHVH